MSPDKSQIIWQYVDDAKTGLKSSLNSRVEDFEKAWFKVLTDVITFRNKLDQKSFWNIASYQNKRYYNNLRKSMVRYLQNEE